jgi:excisionase family DNA binding protein
MMALPATISPKRRMPDIADYMTTEEAAKVLGFHVISIRRMVREGRLKGVKVGPTWLVAKKSMEDYKRNSEGMSKTDPRRGS